MLEQELKKTYIQNPLTWYLSNKLDELYYFKKLNQSLETVLIYLNDMETNSGTGIDEIDIDKKLQENTILSKKKIWKLFDKSIIYQIDRD
jgi:hypothetical protein